MKKTLIVCAVVLAGGAAFGTDYVWQNPGCPVLDYSGWGGAATYDYSGSGWEVPGNWTGGDGTGFPNSAIDTARIFNSPTTLEPAPAGDNYCVTFTSPSYTLGALSFANTSYWRTSGGDVSLRVTKSGGQSGDYWFTSATATGQWGVNVTIDVDGNFRHAPADATNFVYGDYQGLVIMRGNNTSHYMAASQSNNVITQIYGTGIWDNGSPAQPDGFLSSVRVMPGGSIGSHSGVTGNWSARTFIFPDGQANLPTTGSDVNFWYSYRRQDQAASDAGIGAGKLVVTGGVTYPQDVSWYSGWMGGYEGAYEWKVKAYASGQSANLGVGRDFNFNTGVAALTDIVFSTLENGTTNSVNFTVGRDLNIGTTTTTAFNHTNYTTQFIKLNNSTVKVGRNFVMGAADSTWNTWYPQNMASADLGNATITIGGNFTVYRMTPEARAKWNQTNQSTLVFDGNGGAPTQTIRIYCDDNIINGVRTPLHNVVINTKGTVQLDPYIRDRGTAGTDDPNPIWDSAIGTSLRLTGSFDIECGTWVGNGRPITFNGPEHYLTDLTGSVLDDNINLVPGAVLYLGSNITINPLDNLNLGAGACLYLNGFTLTAEGNTYDGCLCQQWCEDGGTIFGAQSVPEPMTLLLLGTGVIGAVGHLRRRRTQ